jgi:hypothetical protein
LTIRIVASGEGAIMEAMEWRTRRDAGSVDRAQAREREAEPQGCTRVLGSSIMCGGKASTSAKASPMVDDARHFLPKMRSGSCFPAFLDPGEATLFAINHR